MKIKFILFIIVFLAVGLRFYKLGKVPPSINWDEASMGFNAYMILKSGRDEFGEKFPLAFRSYDDFKPPLTVYLCALTFKFLPINEWSLRFPSAFLGSLTVILTFLLTKELFKEKQRVDYYALLAAFLLAISPWHVYFSRILFETNIAVFFVVLGIFSFLKFINDTGENNYTGKSKKQFIYGFVAALSFSLSLYTYHSARGFTPLLILSLLLVFWKKLKNVKRSLFLFSILFLLFSLPLLKLTFSSQVQRRIKSVSIFEQERKPFERSVEFLEIAQKQGVPFWLARVFYNRRIEYAKQLVIGYFSHFTPNFLFLKAGNVAMYRPAPNVGLLYLSELPFLLLGFYYLFKKKPQGFLLLVFWVLIAPIPASFTTNPPFVIRTMNFLPVLQILVAYGLINFWIDFKKQKTKKFLLVFYCFLFTSNFYYFIHQYFIHFSLENSKTWQYGYRELVETIGEQKDYNKVILFVRQRESVRETILEKAHGFLAFYLLPEPEEYLSQGGTQLCQFGTTGKMHFNNYFFYPLFCFDEKMSDEEVIELMGEDNLVIFDPLDLRDRVVGKGKHFEGIKTIKFLDDKRALELIKT